MTQKEKIINSLVRQGYRRNDHKIIPGLYAIGEPKAESNVFVTANYKLSFDALREAQVNNCWVMVLDTHGINVWCAAGKGTFSTSEIVRMIGKCHLGSIINHKKIIVPQLGAVGVSAYKVKQMTGFDVVFGPVRADDIGRFLENDFSATSEMRQVSFNFIDRAILAPLEFIQSLKYFAVVFLMVFIVGALGKYEMSDLGAFIPCFVMILSTNLMGAIVFPLIFPLLKGDWFTTKALPLTFIWGSLSAMVLSRIGIGIYEVAGLILMGASLLETHALNFTGATPVASYNETKKETLTVVPYLIAVYILGVVIYALAVGQVIG